MGPVSEPFGAARRRAGRLACAAVAGGALVAVLLAPQPAAAQSASELRSKVEGAQAKAEALASRLESQAADLEASRADAVAAAKREAALNTTLAEGQERARELEAEVADARSDLDSARAHLRRSQRILSDRLVEIYKHGTADPVGLLLESDGYDDLAVRSEYLQRIQDADSSLVDRTSDLRAQVSAELGRVSAARDEQLAHVAELTAARDEIAVVSAEATARANELVAARESQETQLAALDTQVGKWERGIQKAEQVSAAQAEEEVTELMDEYAIPTSIVMCESGGDYTAVNPSSGAGGAYQIMPSTWEAYGGKGLPQDAPPAEQDRIAALIWADVGASAWSCAA